MLADGRHLNINHNQQIVHIPAPQDREIADLGLKLNETYIPFGVEGQAAQERQMAQDNNAANVFAGGRSGESPDQGFDATT